MAGQTTFASASARTKAVVASPSNRESGYCAITAADDGPQCSAIAAGQPWVVLGGLHPGQAYPNTDTWRRELVATSDCKHQSVPNTHMRQVEYAAHAAREGWYIQHGWINARTMVHNKVEVAATKSKLPRTPSMVFDPKMAASTFQPSPDLYRSIGCSTATWPSRKYPERP